jgi:hypothetical protein
MAGVDRSVSGGSDDATAVPDVYRGLAGGPGAVIFTVDVDGEQFAIRPSGDGGTNYDWLSGPNESYGFSSSATPNRSVEEHREHIRVFLAMIDPNTGYIGED